ncbi:hypothetical protein AB0I55_29170 [Actinocatenispora sera]|uniref:hypothetical protein n=1 Tax=Actinocatenispora sera TaxID=390989 RepID=UPI003411AA2E
MGTPHYPQGIGDLISGLRRDVQAARTQAQSRLPFRRIKVALLELFGNLAVRAGGTITVDNSAGSTIAAIGNLGQASGQTIWGMRLARPDGSDALIVYGAPNGDLTFVAIKDKLGNIVVSDDGLSGQGLATPYVPYGPLSMSATDTNFQKLPASTSSSFETLLEGVVPLTHPRIRVQIFWQCDNTALSGDGRLLINGHQIGSTVAANNGDSAFLDGIYDIPGWGDSVSYLQEAYLEVQARRTAGTGGGIRCAVYSLYGVQS